MKILANDGLSKSGINKLEDAGFVVITSKPASSSLFIPLFDKPSLANIFIICFLAP